MDNPSIMSHVSIGVRDLDKALAFYDKVLATIGATRIYDIPGEAAAYGKIYPEFWVGLPYDKGTPSSGNGTHFAFNATDPSMVRAFYETAISAGATDDGPPGPREEYGEGYYGCFVRDPEGHKIEATFFDVEVDDTHTTSMTSPRP